MTPEELAKYRADALRLKQEQQDEQKQRDDEERSRRDAEVTALKNAVEKVALPYLERVSQAMGGSLRVMPVRDTQGELVGVDLILDGRKAELKIYGTSLQAYTKDPMTSQPRPDSRLRSVADVTEENVGNFVKSLVDAGNGRA